MNIVLAQIRKDIVPVRSLLIGMGALLVMTILGRILAATGVFRMSGGSPLAALQFLLIAVLTVRLIHMDSLTGPDAFWRTRPISRPQLLAAKLAFLILPILAFIAMAQPWADIARNPSNGTFGDHCVFIVGLAAFASVTQRFSELAFLFFKAVLFAICMSMAASMLVSILLLWKSNGWLSADAIFGLPLDTLLATTKLFVFAGYIGVVVHQFLTLNTRRSVLAIYGLFSLAALAAGVAERLRG